MAHARDVSVNKMWNPEGIVPRDCETNVGGRNPALRVGDYCVWGEREAFLEEFMAELSLKD